MPRPWRLHLTRGLPAVSSPPPGSQLPISLAVCFLSPGACGPAHTCPPPPTPHPLPSSALPSVKGAATELFAQCRRGCGGVHVLLCRLYPLELWTQARGGLGSGMLTWGALRQGLATAILTQGWQRHNCLEGDSQATGLLPTSSPGTEQVPVLRLQSFLSPLSATRSRAGGRESGCL